MGAASVFAAGCLRSANSEDGLALFRQVYESGINQRAIAAIEPREHIVDGVEEEK
jgi:hypothetical protein